MTEISIQVVLDGCSLDLKNVGPGIQESVLSGTLFLLRINDLLVPGTYGYADESTVAGRYQASETPERMVSYLVERQ